MKRNVLFITYDGLTDPLGQSQVLPYYKGLAKRGHQISILSAEKKDNYINNKDKVRDDLRAHNIHWQYIYYSNRPPFVSTWRNIKKLKGLALSIVKEKGIEIVHCRSIIPAILGDALKRKCGLKLIFDIRGFWADERVDGKLWNLSNPIYRLVYKYFKRKEKYLYKRADHIITLTENAKQYIENTYQHNGKFQVIPCCVDTKHFDSDLINKEELIKLKRQLEIKDEDYVLTYIGSLGTRYLLKEMLLFFRELSKLKETSKFLFISKNNPLEIYSVCKELDINENFIKITSCNYTEIPSYISLANASIFFIVTSHSGKAVSPTKQAEVMSLGLPIIANTGLGDTDLILRKTNAGILVENFSNETFKEKAIELLDFKHDNQAIRQSAIDWFSLEGGIDKYEEVYEKL